jgi:hypothetical protein
MGAKGRVALSATVAVALLACVGSDGAGARAQQDCTWGASSTAATFENGRVVVTGPETSGCTSPAPVDSSTEPTPPG